MPEDMTKLTRLLILEVTSHCNMHCTFCPSDDLVRKKGHVSDEQAIQLIRVAHELAPGIPIMFNVLGEPFLNPKLFNYIALCEKENVPVALITNITLLTPERLRKLFQYSNISLNMSLHTPTDKSFAERGYRKIANFREYMEMVCNAIQEKFRQHSKASIEIYLASELIENLMQNDAGSRLWKVFDDPKEYEAGWQFCAERFAALSAQLAREYPEEFAQGMERVRHDLAPQIAAREMVFRAEDLPEWRLENEKSGWMCAPGVVVRRKGFGMWAYHEKFVQRHAQPGRFVFHEERTEPFKCVGSLTFGILADGTYTLCCQDVEGEMDIGNIASLDPRTAFHSPRRAEIIENCATSRICRRCAGNTVILDTFPLREETQAIDKYGFGWHGVEQYLFGVGGRWTSGNAKSYFYTRLDAESLELRFRSPFHSATKFQLLVSAYDPATKKFDLEITQEFFGEKDRMVELEVPVRLRRNSFHQLAILSPTFAPQGLGSADKRRLGLAVASMQLRGRPYQSLATESDAALNFASAPAAAASAPTYQFPILA
jgi:sulfatase maturation enzyme AslB (radical SAM superfamily)